MKIKQVDIQYPKIKGSTSKTYSGGDDIRFEIDNFNPVTMDLTWKENYTGVGMKLTSSPYTVSVKNVDTYELVATIKSAHAVNYKFASTPKIEVKVSPAPLVIERLVVGGSGVNSEFIISEGATSAVADIFVDDVNGPPLKSDVVPIIIYSLDYNKDLSQPINLDAAALSGTSYQVTNQQIINIEEFLEGTYSLGVKTTDSNYEISLTNPATLVVLPQGQITNIRWKIYEGALEKTKCRTPMELSEAGMTKTFPYELIYSGEQFRFAVDLPSDCSVDAGYGTDGYIVEKISGSGNLIGKDAGTYKTSFRIAETQNVYSIEWTIDKFKFDLTGVKWVNDGKMPFSTNVNEMVAKIDKTTLPKGLDVDDNTGYTGIRQGNHAGDTETVSVTFKFDASDPNYTLNYELPQRGGKGVNYKFDKTGDFDWDMTWTIEKLVVNVDWMPQSYNGYSRQTLKDDKRVVEYQYYLWDNANKTTVGNALSENDIEIVENEVHYYVTKAVIKSAYVNDAEFDKTDVFSPPFAVGTSSTAVNVKLVSDKLTYNGQAQQVKLNLDVALNDSDFDIVYFDRQSTTPLSGAPSNVGDYRVEIALKDSVSGYHLAGDNVEEGVAIIEYSIEQMEVHNDTWNTLRNPPSLKVSAKEVKGIKHEYIDMDGNTLNFSDLKAGNSYKVRAVIADKNNYVFADGTTETDWKEFTVSENEQMYDPDDPNNPYYPSDDEDIGSGNRDDGSGNQNGGGTIDDILNKLKEIPLWQLIASIISIILILIFTGKGAGYLSKAKQNRKSAESRYRTVYAGTTFLGLAFSSWTGIAVVLMVLAAISLVFMIIAKSKYNKSLVYADELRDEYERNKADLESRRRAEEKEDMKMMFMSMMGGNAGGMGQSMPQGGYAYVQQGLGADDIRGIVSETMTALLPGVQQMLPAQASTNDDLLGKLIEQNEKLIEETHKNEEELRDLIRNLSRQDTEKVVEREVAVSSANDEILKSLIEGQRIIMEKLANQSNQPQQSGVQIIEKEVPIEKIVEKIVEVPVEKIVEKEVVKEVPVIKEVKVKAEPKPKKEVAPRLTLDEAYALLSKQQQKYFDGLKQYALSKPGCKEKKSTYAITIGQSTVNPLLKLTIKKDMTVALFKMEDEYLKDIKRDASGDGTKIKVKETEVIISDAQACKAAKNMIDLREDQIERYNDLLKEQRAMNRKK